MLLRRVCAEYQENKNTFSKTQRDVSLLENFLVLRNEPREFENIDTFIDSFLLMNTTTHARILKLKNNVLKLSQKRNSR